MANGEWVSQKWEYARGRIKWIGLGCYDYGHYDTIWDIWLGIIQMLLQWPYRIGLILART